MSQYYYEIFLSQTAISPSSWQNLITSLIAYLGNFKTFKILTTINNNEIRYFIASHLKLPLSFNNPDFLLKEIDSINIPQSKYQGLYFNKENNNLIDIINNFKKKNKQIESFEINFLILNKEFILKRLYLSYKKQNILYKKRLFWPFYSTILSIDFSNSKSYFYKKVPKYLKIEKILHLLTDNPSDNLFKIDTFPYLENNYYLKHTSFDFSKHSLVIGGSGSGKSKFLSLLISNIFKYNSDKYKIVLIDPHDALKDELGAILNKKIIDFKTTSKSINLFKSNIEDINVTIELMLSLFKSLFNDQYNSRLERVMRFSTYLLIADGSFSFNNLKKLLVDLEYRNALVDKLKRDVPPSISYFFLTDYNVIKRENHNDAIAPILSFIDEMQMIPIFNNDEPLEELRKIINDNFLTIFSLNRLNLGDKVTKTIAGFILQQIFILAETKTLDKELIVIIDEVSLLENPILSRFLSELRKFNTSLILAGQYFNQISSELQEAIFANTSNYYLFRVSKNDAISLVDNMELKLVGSDSKEDSYNFLTSLKTRECLVRISKNGTLYPIFKAKTCDFLGTPSKEEPEINPKEEILTKELKFDFKIDNDIKIDELMKKTSSSRKRL